MLLFKKITNRLYQFLDFVWYKKNIFCYLLWPISVIFKIVVFLRREYLQKFQQRLYPVPIVIVGNISVGGVGKTPLVIALTQKLTELGLRVGIVSRGYQASLRDFPYLVTQADQADKVGDEPLLIKLRTNCPVVIDYDRCRAVDFIIEKCNPDIIVSDDGLQHYKMGRTIEIGVIDGSRMFGNGFCLPAGPLRESIKRLKKVDFIVINGEVPKNLQKSYRDLVNINKPLLKLAANSELQEALICRTVYPMKIVPENFYACLSGKVCGLENLNSDLLAIAAIGNPQRFFKTLESLGLKTVNIHYPDHYKFSKEDFLDITKSIIMTEKDFVKCAAFANDRMFFLRVSVIISDKFWDDFCKRIFMQG